MLPNLSVLVAKCRALGVEPKPAGKKLGKEDCVRELRRLHLPEGGLAYTELTPMLCFAEWNLKPEEQERAWTSQKWVAQRKLNGCRMIMHFVKDVGIFAHSRTISVKTWRYQELTEVLLFRDFVPSFDATIDCEAIVEKPIDTSAYTPKGATTKTSLHSTTSLFHLEAENSRKVQIEQDAPIMIQTFDITSFMGTDFRKRPLHVRLGTLNAFRSVIEATEIGKYFQFPEVVREGKRAFFEKIVAEGGEGVILKNMESPYIDSSSRPRTGWIKVKKRIEFDAFVSGFKPGEPGAGYENLVGALEFSVNLKGGGTHVIGFASNLELETRTAMTKTVNGKPWLRNEWIGRVAEISGQDVSAREFRLSHCTLDRWRYEPGPDHKEADQCVVDMADLKAAAEWVA